MAVPINDGFSLRHLPEHPAFNFRLVMAGRLRSFDGCSYNLGGYICWHIVKSGRGTVHCGPHSATIGPGDMFTLVEDRQIQYADNPATPWEFYYLHLEGPAAAQMTREAGFHPSQPWQRPAQPDIVLRHFQHLWKMAQRPEEWKIPRINAELLTLFDELCSISMRVRRTPEELLQQARQLVEDPGYCGVNASELARSLQVDRGTLHRAFTMLTGESPGCYIRQTRLEHAKKLLQEHPALTLASIATTCGFANEKYLIRAFKSRYNQTPGQFRSNQNNKST